MEQIKVEWKDELNPERENTREAYKKVPEVVTFSIKLSQAS